MMLERLDEAGERGKSGNDQSLMVNGQLSFVIEGTYFS